jgi:methyltransferase (TIGR00027 family)
MRDDEPSKTAWRSAMRRAAHQMWDSPRVLDDPLTLKIVGADAEAALRGKGAPATADFESTVRAFAAARSRLVNDALAEAMARGVRQFVVMGAGYETSSFAPREGLRTFEIDHPATQARKKQLLAASGIGGAITFVPVDFKRQTMEAELPRAGWDAAQPTFFSWLGVTSYLSHDEVLAVLRGVAAGPRDSEIVFDVSTPNDHLPAAQRARRALHALKVLMQGERIGTRFDPQAFAAELRGIGFCEVTALEARDINARYFAHRADGLKVSNRSALIRAIV